MSNAFIQSTMILLREGLEAMLVVAALAAYLTKAGAQERLHALYAGAGTAIVASVAAAWIFEVMNNGAHSDVLEGVIILLAAALMLYVSGWLLVRQDPRAWQAYLKGRADEALARRTGAAVAVLAFLAVFREGAETVLFIHALASTSGGWTVGLIGGLLVAAAGLIAMFFFINLVMRRLPLRPVFIVTSGFLFVMAVKFIGQAIQEFQEQQLLPYHDVHGWEWLSNVGLNPTLEALVAQGLVIAFAIATFGMLQWNAARTSATPAE